MTQTALHTPGPWSSEWQFIVAPDVTGNHIDVYIAEICEADDEGRVVGGEEQKANAQLIAAAPELFETLQGLLSEFLAYAVDEPDKEIQQRNLAWIEQSEKAIAKAKGK